MCFSGAVALCFNEEEVFEDEYGGARDSKELIEGPVCGNKEILYNSKNCTQATVSRPRGKYERIAGVLCQNKRST